MSPYVYLALGAICAGIAVACAAVSAAGHRSSAVDRVQAVIDYGLKAGRRTTDTDVSVYLDNDPGQGVVSDVATRLGSIFSARTIIGYRVLLTIVLPVLAFLLVGVHGALDVLIIALALFAGWVLPLTV